MFDYEKVNCINCGKCDDRCNMGLDPRRLLNLYNQFIDGDEDTVRNEISQLPENQHPGRCFGCGACEFFCPNKVEIWKTMGRFANLLK